jgi:hypothetical protein
MNYDEAIVAFHDMHPEYDTANGGTHLLHDKVLDALKRAKKVEKELKYTKEQFDKYWKEVCILKPRLAKVEELLKLYRLEKELKEKYHTIGSLYVMQHVLDELREIAEEICIKENELEEMK